MEFHAPSVLDLIEIHLIIVNVYLPFMKTPIFLFQIILLFHASPVLLNVLLAILKPTVNYVEEIKPLEY
jgi:hypothetical protein